MTHDNDLIRRGAILELCQTLEDEAPSGSYDNGGTTDGWMMACRRVEKAIAALPAVAASQTADPVINAGSRQRVVTGWVIANGQNNRWRCVWKWETNAEWTDDISKALKFATRDDAEAFSADDEDAWLIQEVPIAALDVQPGPRDAQIAALVEAVKALEMWDAARGYPVPYRVRDPLRAALAAVKGGDA